jgi:hypothetical protein
MTPPDPLVQAQRIVDRLSPERADELVTSTEERALQLSLASTWALVDIAQSLRTLAAHTPTPA